MPAAPFSVRFDTKLKTRIAKEAKRRNRSESFIINNAIKRYFEGLDNFEREMREAEAEADKGVFISGEKIFEWMRSWGTENELPPPKPDIFPATKGEPKNKKKAA
jgi:predicted transcriptional regulator